MSKLPTVDECFNILKENMVPNHIIDHSEMVARVGHVMATTLNQQKGLCMDLDLVVAACLLHDIKKMHCIETGCDHALAAHEYIWGLGFEEVADVVRQHYRLDHDNKDFSRLNPVHICFYADNRVKHHRIVPVEERFRDILERYGRDQKSIREITARLHETKALEAVLFEGLDFSPAELEKKVGSVDIFIRRKQWETI